MAAALTSAALTLAGGVVGNLMYGGRPKPPARLVNTSRLRGLSSARAGTANALAQSNIKQAGAAGGLPAGAISSALRSSQVRGGDPRLESQILGAQQFNANQQTGVDMREQQAFDSLMNFNMSGLGTLSKIAILSKMGLLSPGGGGGGAGIGQGIAGAGGGGMLPGVNSHGGMDLSGGYNPFQGGF